MVVNIESSRLSHDRPVSVERTLRHNAHRQRAERPDSCLHIGLLNNMAGAAFQATERQFLSLLDTASDGIPIHVSFFTLPGLSLADAGGSHFASHYASVESLFDSHLDGLIVTGREPKTADLRDEPYWKPFAQVVDWARDNTYSTAWSCLAAHAAVLHLDGVVRRRSEEKHFGVFECTRESDHTLMQNVTPIFQVPHSRWNGIAQQDLTDRGYEVLSRIAQNGVDIFVRQEKSLFVFFQGHLEYETATLMREYRRDVGRFIKGEMRAYPLLPGGYFNPAAQDALSALRDSADSCRNTDLLHKVATTLEHTTIENKWDVTASQIYKNWLHFISARKSESESLFKKVLSAQR